MNQDFEKLKKDMDEINMKLKGQIDQQEKEISDMQREIASLKSSLSNVAKPKDTYQLFTAYKLFGGFPIYNTTTNLKGFPQQGFLVNASANTTPRKLVGFQIGNTVSVVALT